MLVGVVLATLAEEDPELDAGLTEVASFEGDALELGLEELGPGALALGSIG